MKELNGVHLEYDVYTWEDITCEQLGALEELGVEVLWDYEHRTIKILSDTRVQDYERCGEPLDSLEMIG